MKPVLVILAAGASTRLGRAKALVPITPRTPLELLLDAGSVLDDGPPLVVTGADHAAIARALPPGVEVLHNPRWAAGRTGGVALAAGARRGRDLCLAPVDVPLVPRAVFEALLGAWSESREPARGWLAPRAPGGRFGHPVVVGRALLEELARWGPDEPLARLRARAERLAWIDVDTESVTDDLDDPADLEGLRARARRAENPHDRTT